MERLKLIQKKNICINVCCTDMPVYTQYGTGALWERTVAGSKIEHTSISRIQDVNINASKNLDKMNTTLVVIYSAA